MYVFLYIKNSNRYMTKKQATNGLKAVNLIEIVEKSIKYLFCQWLIKKKLRKNKIRKQKFGKLKREMFI